MGEGLLEREAGIYGFAYLMDNEFKFPPAAAILATAP